MIKIHQLLELRLWWILAVIFICTFSRESPFITADIVPLLFRGPQQSTAFPWHAIIFVATPLTYDYMCGGTLIDEYHVLTAAHCTYKDPDATLPYRADEFVIILAPTSGQYFENGPNSLKVKVSAVIPYNDNDRQYKGLRDDFRNDVALFRLAASAKIGTRYIRPAKLPPPYEQVYNGMIMQVNGYGTTSNENTTPSSQFFGIKVVVNTDSCPRDSQTVDSTLQFCAVSMNLDSGICKGDGGGGALYWEPNHRYWSIQGIVSYGIGDRYHNCFPNFVFTKVQYYISWINSVTRPLQRQIITPLSQV